MLALYRIDTDTTRCLLDNKKAQMLGFRNHNISKTHFAHILIHTMISGSADQAAMWKMKLFFVAIVGVEVNAKLQSSKRNIYWTDIFGENSDYIKSNKNKDYFHICKKMIYNPLL